MFSLEKSATVQHLFCLSGTSFVKRTPRSLVLSCRGALWGVKKTANFDNFWLLAPPGAHFGPPGALLGALLGPSWGQFLASCGLLGLIFRLLGLIFIFWRLLGLTLGPPAAFWSSFLALLGPPGLILGSPGAF